MSFIKPAFLGAAMLVLTTSTHALPVLSPADAPDGSDSVLSRRNIVPPSWTSFVRPSSGLGVTGVSKFPSLQRDPSQLVLKQYEGVSVRQQRSSLSQTPLGATFQHQRGFVGTRPERFYHVGGETYAGTALRPGLGKGAGLGGGAGGERL